jgi:hypothetical protein
MLIASRNAGFFIYIDLSPYLPDPDRPAREREFVLAQRFLDAGVFLHPGEEHGKVAGWFRLVFAHEEGVLRVGLARYVYSCLLVLCIFFCFWEYLG